MIHANGHLICAIDTETSGLDPDEHCIWQLAVIPLNNDLEPSEDHYPFNIEMDLSKWDNIDYQYLSKKKIEWLGIHGMNPNVALDLFVEWIERLGLPERKRIMPLAHNWPFDRSFIEKWMGPKSFNLYIDAQYRDTMTSTVLINDTDAWGGKDYHFAKHKLSFVCNQLGLECEPTMFHDAYYDAIMTAKAYKRICQTTRCLA